MLNHTAHEHVGAELQWYAVNTRSHHEKRVAEILHERSIESFLPLYQCRHRWKNGVNAELSLPFFPCYLFVRTTMQNRLRVLEAPGVLGLAASSTRPTPVPDNDIAALQLAIQRAGAEPHPYLNIGERVRVAVGPLAGLEGILTRRKQGLRVILSVELIMQSVAVEVSESEIEAAAERTPWSYRHMEA